MRQLEQLLKRKWQWTTLACTLMIVLLLELLFMTKASAQDCYLQCEWIDGQLICYYICPVETPGENPEGCPGCEPLFTILLPETEFVFEAEPEVRDNPAALLTAQKTVSTNGVTFQQGGETIARVFIQQREE